MEVILVGDLPVTAMEGTLKAWGSLARQDVDKVLESYEKYVEEYWKTILSPRMHN